MGDKGPGLKITVHHGYLSRNSWGEGGYYTRGKPNENTERNS